MTLPDLNDDVLREILDLLPSLKDISLVNGRLRALAIPQLFKKVAVRGPKGHPQGLRPGNWNITYSAITSLSNNPVILSSIKMLKFEMFDDGDFINMYDLVGFLGKLSKLKGLTLCIPAPHLIALQAAFNELEFYAPLALSNVTTLVTYPSAASLVDRFPNLEVVSLIRSFYYPECTGDQAHAMFKSLGTRTNQLKQLEASFLYWSVPEILDLAEAVPQIERLNMGCRGRDYSTDMAAIMAILGSKFKYLKRLDITRASDLRLGFDGWPFCGNAFHGPNGHELMKSLQRAEEKAEREAARLAFGGIGSLEVLWIGDHVVARKLEGKDDVGFELTKDRALVRDTLSW
ncbi:hypothetical protein BCR34DRAFT_608892 [Clohesyomyces aquaticus]|uniref:F-box domain-containing protein n=1 Tax=Clohesyomyces aquaticus TaxID=1231657 RepID=A0A1Y1Y229_9PLEO|nr:hypothetical protein BCR34DRAFT_608892 [Clohesyomyces aquaticus]